MSDLPDVYLDDSARTVAVTLTPDQRRNLLHTLRRIQRDPEIGRPYTPGGDLSGRLVVAPGDRAVPGMTIVHRILDTEIRVVHILAGP